MSYVRRLEIEAMPAEIGWSKWEAVIGMGTELVERKQLEPVTIWVSTPLGPQKRVAYLYERWRFAQDKQPVDIRSVCYTVWHDERNYTDYSPRALSLYCIAAESREEVCKLARAILVNEIESLQKTLADKQAILEKFI